MQRFLGVGSVGGKGRAWAGDGRLRVVGKPYVFYDRLRLDGLREVGVVRSVCTECSANLTETAITLE